MHTAINRISSALNIRPGNISPSFLPAAMRMEITPNFLLDLNFLKTFSHCRALKQTPWFYCLDNANHVGKCAPHRTYHRVKTIIPKRRLLFKTINSLACNYRKTLCHDDISRKATTANVKFYVIMTLRTKLFTFFCTFIT